MSIPKDFGEGAIRWVPILAALLAIAVALFSGARADRSVRELGTKLRNLRGAIDDSMSRMTEAEMRMIQAREDTLRLSAWIGKIDIRPALDALSRKVGMHDEELRVAIDTVTRRIAEVEVRVNK